MFKPAKKAETNFLVLVIIVVAVVIVVFYLGYSTLQKMKESAELAQFEEFRNHISNNLALMKIQRGVTKTFTYNLGSAKEVCFFDTERRDIILRSPEIQDPYVKDILKTEATGINLFIYLNNGKFKTYSVPEISINHYPFYECIEPVGGVYIFTVTSGKKPQLNIDPIKCILIKNNYFETQELVSKDKHFSLLLPPGITTDISDNIICVEKASSTGPGKTERYRIYPGKINFGKPVSIKYELYPEQDCSFQFDFPKNDGVTICNDKILRIENINYLENPI